MKPIFLNDDLRVLCNKKSVDGGKDFIAVMDKEESKKFNGLENIPYQAVLEMALYATDNGCRLYSAEDFVKGLKNDLDISKKDFIYFPIPKFDKMKSLNEVILDSPTEMRYVNGIDLIRFSISDAWSSKALIVSFWKNGAKILTFSSNRYFCEDSTDANWGTNMNKKIYSIYRHIYANAERILTQYKKAVVPYYNNLSFEDFMSL